VDALPEGGGRKRKLKELATQCLEGELRVMRARKVTKKPDLGRIYVIDLDVENGHNARQIDLRTVEWVILKGVKYSLKKR